MKWFEGSINEAVATSKSRKAIFVVFIEGKNDESVEFSRALDAPEVSSRLERDDFVAVRLEGGSESYWFFMQIYQYGPIPSLFFIGEYGATLDFVLSNKANPSDLVEKIDAVLEKAGKSSKNVSQNLISAEQKAAEPSISPHGEKNAGDEETATTSASTVESVEVTTSKQQTNNESTDIVCDKKEGNASQEGQKQDDSKTVMTEQQPEANEESSTKDLTAEEKLERAKQLIEIQRRQRVEEEEKKEREKELERRRLGRDVQKFRQKQQELEVKHAHEERMKEKAAEAAAREKVRKQIEQDRLERKQRELALQQEMQKQQNTEQVRSRSPASTDATLTRIQFRLPTGTPHMGQFDPQSNLGSLRSYVRENIDLPFQQFSMSTTFPRRDLTREDDNKTLLELELVPTAVILILPLKTSATTTTVTATQDVGFLSRVIWSLFAPIIGVYNYLVNYFTRGARTTSGEPKNDAPSTSESASSADAAVPPNLQNIANSGLLRRYLSSQGGTKIRAEGNIHRLHSGGDDNDENNTWNGNSTQQM